MIKFFNLPKDITAFIKEERENFDYKIVKAEFDTALKASGIVSSRLLTVTSKVNDTENPLSLSDLSRYANHMNEMAIKDLEAAELPGELSQVFVAYENKDGKIQQQMAINDFLPELSRYLVFLDFKKSIKSVIQAKSSVNEEIKNLNKEVDKEEIVKIHQKAMSLTSEENYLTNTMQGVLSPSSFKDFCKNRFYVFPIEVKSDKKSPRVRP